LGSGELKSVPTKTAEGSIIVADIELALVDNVELLEQLNAAFNSSQNSYLAFCFCPPFGN
jgi:hypothetical protein